MRKLVRPYVYKEDYDKVIAYAKSNFLRGSKSRLKGRIYSFAQALEEMIR